MSPKEIHAALSSLAGTSSKVRIARRQPKQVYTNGFVVAVGEQLVLLQAFHDFYPEGLAILRIHDITDVRSGEHERFWERMLQGEGITAATLSRELPPLDSMPRLLSALLERGENVILECEDDDGPICDFYIGCLLKVDDVVVEFANFDALGRWDEEPHRIELDEITLVELETPYLRILSKHVQSPCPFR